MLLMRTSSWAQESQILEVNNPRNTISPWHLSQPLCQMMIGASVLLLRFRVLGLGGVEFGFISAKHIIPIQSRQEELDKRYGKGNVLEI